MTIASARRELDDLLAGELGRDNFDELVRHVYDSYSGVDFTDSRIRELEAQVEAAPEEEQHGLLEKLGTLHFARGNYAPAAEQLEKVRTRKTAAHFLGRAYLKLGREREAIEYLDKGRSGHEDQETDILMIEAYCNLREYEPVEELLAGLPNDQEASADVLYAKGRAAEVQGEYGRAMEHFEAALDREAEHSRSLFRLALNCDLNGEDDRARELYERCVNLQPTYVGALINLGVLCEDSGDYEQAVNCYKRVLAIEPTHKQAQLYLKDAESSLTMYVDVSKPQRLRTMEEIFGLPEGGLEESGTLSAPTARDNALNDSEVQDLLGRYQATGARTGRAISALEAGEDIPVQERLSMSAEELELSTRSRKCMERLGVTTVGQLIQLTTRQLLGVPNFGATSLKEIETKLGALGLSLKDD